MISRVVKFIGTENSRIWCPWSGGGQGGEEEWRGIDQWSRISVWGEKKVLEMIESNSCTTCECI